MYPFSFSEIVEFKNIKSDKEIPFAFDEYLKYGGFPSIVYLKLIQDGYDVFVGKYNEHEIDFVCFKEGKIK